MTAFKDKVRRKKNTPINFILYRRFTFFKPIAHLWNHMAFTYIKHYIFNGRVRLINFQNKASKSLLNKRQIQSKQEIKKIIFLVSRKKLKLMTKAYTPRVSS